MNFDSLYIVSNHNWFKWLHRLLKNSLNDKDKNRRREVVKKIIAFMTLGNYKIIHIILISL